MSVLRFEDRGLLTFERSVDKVVAFDKGEPFKVICCSELTEKAAVLYDAIMRISANKASISNMQAYLETLRFSSPKAPKLPEEAAAAYGAKSDIIISTEDPIDRARATEGYSIKSHLGSPSTLFNMSANSGLIFEVAGCDVERMHRVNAVKSELGLYATIKDCGMRLELVGSKSPAFQDNVSYIDLQMINLISTMLLVRIGYLAPASSQATKSIIKRVAEEAPIPRVRESWYEANMKEFLFDSFAGMTATTPWDGRRRMTGGYIDVGRDGEILFYRARSDDVFSEYLYENTYIDLPSRGVNKDIAHAKALAYLEGRNLTASELNSVLYNKSGKKKAVKSDSGYVFEQDGRYFIAVNFTVRFR